MKLYQHQLDILKEDPEKAGLFLGTGSGKTRTALLLARKKTVIIAPKTQVEDENWPRELKALGKEEAMTKGYALVKMPVVETFDKFKTRHQDMPDADTLIVDEAHGMLGLTPNTRYRKKVETWKASQRFEALLEYVERVKPARIYLCTATIVKSPMTVLAAKWILRGRPADDMKEFYAFRYQFYTKLPMPGREVWAPKKDQASKEALAKIVHNLGFVGRLEDYFDVPEQTFRTMHVELTQQQKDRLKKLHLEYPEPIVRIGKRHQVENGVLTGDQFSDPEHFTNGKIDALLELATEFPRMVVFAKYTMQVQAIADAMRAAYKERSVITMTGESVKRGELIAFANSCEECVFIVQAQISAGWELPDFPVMVFASRTYSFVDYQQALGRILRANHLKKNLYINLVVPNGVDEAVDAALTNKQDFDEKLYADKY